MRNTLHMRTATLSSNGVPEEQCLTGEDFEGYKWAVVVGLGTEHCHHTEFISKRGQIFEVPNTELNYEVSETELDSMLKNGLQLPHENKHQY